jgi:hypothetical protein
MIVRSVERRRPAMSVYVHYKVPLVAEVEVETGEVLSVHLDDESIDGPLRATAGGVELSPSERERAMRIAESASWPGWQAGR